MSRVKFAINQSRNRFDWQTWNLTISLADAWQLLLQYFPAFCNDQGLDKQMWTMSYLFIARDKLFKDLEVVTFELQLSM